MIIGHLSKIFIQGAKNLPRLRVQRLEITAAVSLECFLLAVLGFEGIVEFDGKLVKFHQIENCHLHLVVA